MMDDDIKSGRERGRPTNAEVFGDAAGNPLAQLVLRTRAQLIRDGVTQPILTIDAETGARRRRRRTGVPIIAPKRRVAPSQTHSAPLKKPVKKGRNPKLNVPPHLRTEKDTVVHEWGLQSVARRDNAHRRLRKMGCMDGDHVDRFMRDYEMCGSDLRSRGFDLGSGGRGSPFPEAKVDAAGRLADLRKFLGEGEFDLIVVFIFGNATQMLLHEKGGEEHVVIRREIKDAFERLACFYTPGRAMKKRTWEAATRIIQEMEREFSK